MPFIGRRRARFKGRGILAWLRVIFKVSGLNIQQPFDLDLEVLLKLCC
jgi:hypothetical protein